MLIYLLLTVSCSIKEPSKTFQLTCKPKVERFFLAEKDCKEAQTVASTCITVQVNKSSKAGI